MVGGLFSPRPLCNCRCVLRRVLAARDGDPIIRSARECHSASPPPLLPAALTALPPPAALPPPPAPAGPNGCGKSSVLDALLFAFAAPTKTFGVSSLTELANSDSMEVGGLRCHGAGATGSGNRARLEAPQCIQPAPSPLLGCSTAPSSSPDIKEYMKHLSTSLSGARLPLAWRRLARRPRLQVCEVCVQLAHKGEAHSVAAALTPDGSRAFKVKGR